MSHDVYTWFEPIVVALIVLVAGLAVVRKHAPGLWMRFGGKHRATGCGHGDESGANDNVAACGTGCGSCGSGSPAKPREHTIHVHKA